MSRVMKDIQFLRPNNVTVEGKYVFGQVKECTHYCKGDTLVISTIDTNSIVTGRGFVVVNSPTGEDIDITIEVGVPEIGHNIATIEYKGHKVEELTFNPEVTVARENVLVTLNEDLPKDSIANIYIEYIPLNSTEDGVPQETPDICSCPEDCNVYGD